MKPMHAIQVSEEGNHFEWSEVPTPNPGERQVLVSVKASGVNRADILQSKGLYPPPEGASEILGLELAGTIEETGNKVQHWKTGDHVMALVPGGAYAEKAIVPEEMLLPIPESWTFEKAAALPEALYTAFVNLIIEGGLTQNERVLIHSGAGGIGSIAIQLAQSWGAEVAAVAGTDEKALFCKELGANHGLNRQSAPLKEQISELWPDGCQLVLDTIGNTEYADLHTRVLSYKGRWILIGLLGGIKAEVNMAKVLGKNLILKGSTLRSKPQAEKNNLTEALKNQAWPLVENGQIAPVIDQVFHIREAKAAHNYLLENTVKGKVVLTVNS